MIWVQQCLQSWIKSTTNNDDKISVVFLNASCQNFLTFSNCTGTADALGTHTDLQHTLTNSIPFNIFIFSTFPFYI